MTAKFSIRRVSLGLILIVGLAILEPWNVMHNIYEWFWVAVLAGIYWILHRQKRLQSVSFLAIVSLTTAILNPEVTHLIFTRTGLPWIGRGDSELRSFAFGVLAAITGHVALARIRRANPPVRGLVAARTGLVMGYLWAVGWFLAFSYFVWAMSG